MGCGRKQKKNNNRRRIKMEVIKKGQILTEVLPASIRACLKLAELEKEWPRVVGGLMAERSSPTACEFSSEGLVITINVISAGILPAVKSRRGALVRAISRFMCIKSVKLDIRVGKVTKLSQAKESLPDYKRRAPIIVSDRAVEKNTKFFSENTIDPELAEAIAKIKVLTEKLNARKKS